MAKDESDWGVIFTDAALDEIGKEIRQHLRKGTKGSYMPCKRVDMDQPYLHMVVDVPLSEGPPFELGIYVPHNYIKLIMSGGEEKLEKVAGFTGTSKKLSPA